MDNVDDYSVYVIQIKTLLRQLEDYCLKAEVGVTKEEFEDAYALARELEFATINLRGVILDNYYGKKEKP